MRLGIGGQIVSCACGLPTNSRNSRAPAGLAGGRAGHEAVDRRLDGGLRVVRRAEGRESKDLEVCPIGGRGLLGGKGTEVDHARLRR